MEFIRQNHVDVIFLDIEMEEQRAGLELARNLTQRINSPSIIFVTAHPEYALEGYSNYPLPLHYLNKPIDESLLTEALQRARKEINPGRLALKHKEVLGSVDISSSPNECSGQMQKAQKILGFLFKA